MIVVQETFICKPGNASKLARLLKEIMGNNPEHMHILTDMTGEFNRVIMMSKYESLTAYEQFFQQYMQDTEAMRIMKEKMQGYQDMYLTGTRENYQAW